MAKRWEGSEPKCSPLNMKTTAALRAKLEEAARASGRCLTEEVLYRVERSFLTDDVARVTRETIRQEMRAEFEARREAATFNVGRQTWTDLSAQQIWARANVKND